MLARHYHAMARAATHQGALEKNRVWKKLKTLSVRSTDSILFIMFSY
jgi:hypothetical protein